MQHPGPPQFMAVGETVQLSPRDPDPTFEYSWRVRSAPATSTVELGDESVVEFTPDAAGTYTLEMEGHEGRSELTVRVFPGEFSPQGRGGKSFSGMSGMSGMSGVSGVSGVSGISGISGISGVSGSGSSARGATRSGGSGGRPRVRLNAWVEGDRVVVEADPQPNPDSATPREDLGVEFVVDDRWPVARDGIEVDGWRLTMPADAFEEKTRVHAVALDDTYSVADAVEVRRKGTTVDFRAEA